MDQQLHKWSKTIESIVSDEREIEVVKKFYCIFKKGRSLKQSESGEVKDGNLTESKCVSSVIKIHDLSDFLSILHQLTVFLLANVLIASTLSKCSQGFGSQQCPKAAPTSTLAL